MDGGTQSCTVNTMDNVQYQWIEFRGLLNIDESGNLERSSLS